MLRTLSGCAGRKKRNYVTNFSQVHNSAFFAHVSVKLFVFTVPGFVGYLISLGLPPVLAYLTIPLELLGGLALISGSMLVG